MPVDEALERFVESINEGTGRSLHVGTVAELDRIKKKADLEKRVDKLSEELEELKAGPVQSDTIHIPTRDEMIQFLKKGTT